MNGTAMPPVNLVKERLTRGELVRVLSVRFARTMDIVGAARTAGFHSLYVDMQHSTISLDDASQICMAAGLAGMAPFVRVPGTDPEAISGALDGGAYGIIVPQIRDAADAAAVVRAARFPPIGDRSGSSALPQLGFAPVETAEGNRVLNDLTMVVPMIETASALEDVDAIAATEGVDMLLIGGNDLTTDLGIPGQLEHPTAVAAYRRIADACAAHGKFLGAAGLTGGREALTDLVHGGVRYISLGTDFGFFLSGATRAAAAWSEDLITT